MANKYPYVASSGPLAKTVDHLRRRAFPKELTAETLRKLGVAPKNESYVINVLRFLGLIDEEGRKVDEKTAAFVQHKDEEFQSQFGAIVRDSYGELFELHGEDAWGMDRSSLVQFFRSSDHSTEIVGGRQAGTFQYLAALSGYGSTPPVRETVSRKPAPKKTSDASSKKIRGESAASSQSQGEISNEIRPDAHTSNKQESNIGLTVRIEVNLPADGNQETYDSIFRSIRKNLIDGQKS